MPRAALAPRTIVAWNGTSRFCPDVLRSRRAPSEGVVNLFTLCRLVPRKNVASAVSAVSACTARRAVRLRYGIAGRGIDADRITRTIRDGGIGDAVRCIDYLDADQFAHRYRAADIFLHPQIALDQGDDIEGFGLVVADAMASGLVCIVGRDGGPVELIQHGVTGLIVDGRSVASISAAIEHPASIAEMSLWANDNLCWKAHCRASVNGVIGVPAVRRGAWSWRRLVSVR